jgi:nucleotide-binding universal stress UspA family protein
MTHSSLPAATTDPATEFRLKSILLPTDFSDASDRAAYVARELAAHFKSKLFLVHAVWEKSYDWGEPLYQLAPSEEIALKLTADFGARHRIDVLPIEFVVRSGEAVDVVKAVVAEKKIDLIVLGTNGLQGPAKLLFGGYAEKIYRNALCPVLTVGPHASLSKCYGRFQSIVLAINPEMPATTDALHYAMTLARACGAYLTVASILPQSLGVHGEKLYRLEEEKREQVMRLLVESQLALPHKPEVIVGTGHISEEIIKVAIGCGADLIVKGLRPASEVSERTHLPKGFTYPISVNAHCPVLTVGSRERAV